MPERHKCVDDEPWGSYGIRRIVVKNFVVYYRIDDASHRVYILNIIYTKRDQMRMLAQIKMGLLHEGFSGFVQQLRFSVLSQS